MEICSYQKKDLQKVSLLLKEFLEYTRKSYSKDVLEFENYVEKDKEKYIVQILNYFINLENSYFLVAKDGQNILGYIVGYIVEKPYNVLHKTGHIQSFFVSKKSRSLGVGKKLYDSLIEWFKKTRM
jgi:ribosomal protein S18 acetylase RimI-like enzyme